MKDVLLSAIVLLAAWAWCYLFALAVGRGWKHGRGELPTIIVANNPKMEVHNPKIQGGED